ncbi:carbohydrate sulfotransferase 3-like [Branchiostoma lanceolatum]|uniref:carbohydrate sulfotransferase 3-like n=1 Tax=Branchiostoma lanceolatum TaxID=7740 RepID=UPI003455CF61
MMSQRLWKRALILISLITLAMVAYNIFNTHVYNVKYERTDQNVTENVQQRTALSKYDVPVKTRKPAIIIMSQMRSGSSFVAEIFNQHPGAFYVFEPLWAVSYLSNGTYNNATWQRSMITALMTCQFEGLEQFLSFYLNDVRFAAVPKSEALLNVCKGYHKTHQPCPIPWLSTPSVLGRSCSVKNFTVFKTIRVTDIDLIWSAMENIEKEIDLKIIHLVRDPRGIIASRMGVKYKHVKGTSYADKNVEDYGLYGLCHGALRSMQPKLGTNSFLRDKYALVRYEDIIDDLTGMVEKLYNFVGVPHHPDILRWMQLNTKSAGGGPFSTTRNAKETANKWRSKLTFNQVKTIQENCAETMHLFGYKFIADDRMLRNTSISLLGELNQDLMVIQ